MRRFIPFVLLLLLVVAAVLIVRTSPEMSGAIRMPKINESSGVHELSDELLFEFVNSWLVRNGREPYIEDEALCKIAEERVAEIESDISHDQFFGLVDSTNFERLGENLAWGHPSEQSVLKGWLQSPPHRENLEHKGYLHSCIRCVDEGNGWDNRCVHIFGEY